MKFQIFRKKNPDVLFLTVNKDEAISLIKSLSSQLYYGNSTEGRVEYTTEDGEYFSVAVDFGSR